jgi:hypothetical protein
MGLFITKQGRNIKTKLEILLVPRLMIFPTTYVS